MEDPTTSKAYQQNTQCKPNYVFDSLLIATISLRHEPGAGPDMPYFQRTCVEFFLFGEADPHRLCTRPKRFFRATQRWCGIVQLLQKRTRMATAGPVWRPRPRVIQVRTARLDDRLGWSTCRRKTSRIAVIAPARLIAAAAIQLPS